MFRCPRLTRKALRPLRSIFNFNVRSYKYHSSRSTLLPQRSCLSTLLHSMVFDTSQAFRFRRCCPIGWRLRYSFREYSPPCLGNEYPANRWNTYSADTFDTSTSRFPTHLELHSSKRPSNQLNRYVRRWEHELRLDSRDTLPRWRSERDVLKAACIVFLLRYEPDKERREDRLKEALKVLKTGLQADSRSSPPRWNVIQRRKIKKLVVRLERTHASEVAATKQKDRDESQSFRSCGKIVSYMIFAIIILLLDARAEAAQRRAIERVLKKVQLIHETVHCYGNPAYAMVAVEASPLSAAYSDSLYETAGACCLRDEAIQNYAKYSKCGQVHPSWLYVSEWNDEEPGDKTRYIPGIIRRMRDELKSEFREGVNRLDREERRKRT